MTFKELGVIEPILKALSDKGYTHPTPIQAQAIPILLNHTDLLGCAQTGTGKTAAFSIPIIQHIYNDNAKGSDRKIKSLIVTPTRELAIQIGENIREYTKYTRIRSTVIFGGVKQGKQTAQLQKGIDILVATPGRLLDLIGQGFISLAHVKYAVLDEADHMLDMGFIHDMKRIVKLLPANRQSLLFSATMPKDIITISEQLLGKFEQVTIAPEQATAERVDQEVYMVTKKDKKSLLEHILLDKKPESTLVFSRTKHGANKIVRILNKQGFKAVAIHGNKSQGARQKALQDFKDGKINILVATDIAARGIDVDELELVINYDLPNVPETYVHRIGRTGRAAASGTAISFCNAEERAYLKDIEKLIRQDIPVIDDHPYVDDSPTPSKSAKSKSKPQGGRSNRQKSDRPKSNKRRPNRNKSSRQGSEQKSEDRKDEKQNAARSTDARSSEPKRSKNHKKKRRPNKSGDRQGAQNQQDTGGRKKKSKLRAGQKEKSDYSGRYRPKGTMWELD